MATLAARPVGPTPRYRRVPWSLAAWRQALFLIGGIPVQIVALLVIVLCCIGAPKVWPLPLIGLEQPPAQHVADKGEHRRMIT